jgi:hypothetical protein
LSESLSASRGPQRECRKQLDERLQGDHPGDTQNTDLIKIRSVWFGLFGFSGGISFDFFHEWTARNARIRLEGCAVWAPKIPSWQRAHCLGNSRLDFGIRLLDFLNSKTLIAAKIIRFQRIDPKIRCSASGLIRATSFNPCSRNRQSAFDTRSAALPLRNRERRADNANPVINVSKAHSVRG